jgi:DNA-binding response OmpR family regulator
VLDDDPSILAIVKYIMERDDVHVITLDDPEQLHDRLTDLAPSLLLMDVNLQGRSGIDMARELRGHAEWRDLPIILFSTETEPAVRELAYQAGADEFLPKPIVPAELRSRIAERLERHRLRRLSEGLHPGTGLPLAARTAREAPVAFLAARHAQAGCSVIVIRPDGDERPAELSVAWLRECQRIARDLTGAGAGGKGGGGFVGYLDGVSVIAVLALSGEDAVARAATLAAQRAADVPPWHAGVAHNGDLTSADLDTVRRAAEYALDSGRHDAGAPVHRWHAESANVAPDVIVVEDDPALSDMVQYALRAAGFSFRAFRTGPEALDGMLAMRTMGRRPLVLLDVDLPGMDGHSLHERLRLERPGIFRVVFVSVHSSEAEQIRALKAGALDYIPKPLSLRVLTAKIPVWLERSRAP